MLRGEVQQRGADGIWRTVLTASGHTVHDHWKMPQEWREDMKEFVTASYVPGPTGAYMPYVPPRGVFTRVNII